MSTETPTGSPVTKRGGQVNAPRSQRDGAAPDSGPPRRTASGAARRVVANQQTILLLVLLVLVVVFGAINPKFLSLGVAGNILLEWAPVALIAAGETFVIVSGGIDLSVGSTITISGVIAAFAMRALTAGGVPDAISLILGTFVSVLVGAMIGVINSVLINQARIVPFVATLATLGVGAGLSLVLSGGAPVNGGPPSAIAQSAPLIGPFSWPVLVVGVILAVCGAYLHLTRFGRYTFAIGGNPFSATAAGIGVKRHLAKVFILSGALAGAAGIVVYMTLNAGSPSAGTGNELNAIAAVVIGGASLAGGVGRMSGTVLGSLILATVTSGLIVINIDPNWNQVAVAVLIASAVTLQTLRGANRRRTA